VKSGQKLAIPKFRRQRDTRTSDRVFYWMLKSLAWSLIAILVGIVVMLVYLALPALKTFGSGFFSRNDWNPPQEIFGAVPFIFGTIVSSVIALLIATPISIGVALFLTELAPRSIGKVVGFLVEMLAAIPSVVYGLWGIFILSPYMMHTVQPMLIRNFGPESPFGLKLFSGPAYGFGLLTAGVVLAIMITPTISAISREIFNNVPSQIREASLGLGATRWEMIKMSVVATSQSGLLGAIILGLGRALGETMAVAMVIGNRNEIPDSILKPAQTMASVIALEYPEATGLHMSSLAGVGLALLAVSILVNSFARIIIMQVEGGRR
jgi:phosphate transport system permease protein